MKMKFISATFLAIFMLIVCNNNSTKNASTDSTFTASDTSVNTANALPLPFATKSVTNRSDVIGWTEGKMPVAPQGFYGNKICR